MCVGVDVGGSGVVVSYVFGFVASTAAASCPF